MAEEQGRTWTETITVGGGQLLDKVLELIHAGNVRQISIKRGDRVIVSLPVTLGAVAAIVAPVLVAVGAVAALATHCTIEVVRYESAPEQQAGGSGDNED